MDDDVFIPNIVPAYGEYSRAYEIGYAAAINDCIKVLKKKRKKMLDNKKMVVRFGGVKVC